MDDAISQGTPKARAIGDAKAAAPWFHWLATAAFLGLTLTAALSRSVTPVVLGRYSRSLFGYELVNLVILGLLLGSARRPRLRTVAAVLAVGSTFVAPMNDAIRHVPGLLPLLALVRLLAGLELTAAEFDRFRARGSRRGVLLGLGVALAMLSVIDLALWTIVRRRPDYGEDFEGYRDRYALERVTPSDILLVGDSFVWGHGVRKDERFGDVVEQLYAREGRRVRVYSLGIRGAGTATYLRSLARVPADRRAGVVIITFYLNDLAPKPRARWKLLEPAQRATWALGLSSLTFRAIHDNLGKIESPNVERYHQGVVEDYRRDDPTFGSRWAEMAATLGRIAGEARTRSPSRPLLVILPLMVDFHDYPLTRAHADLRTTAEGLGFDVLDLLAPFREELGDGTSFRVSPSDNHFDARVHAFVARAIKKRLDAREDTSRLGRTRAQR